MKNQFAGYINYVEICIRYPDVFDRDWSEEMLKTLVNTGLLRYRQVDLQFYYAENDLVRLLSLKVE